MILGLSTYGFVHTALCLLALVLGLIVVIGLVGARRLDTLTLLFLAIAVVANATGFGFPADFGVPHYLGSAALVFLLAAILARYVFRLAGHWRWIYVIAAVAAVHSLMFFTVGEAFRRVPALNALAPNLTERPFVLAQVVVGALFVLLAIAAVRQFRPTAAAA